MQILLEQVLLLLVRMWLVLQLARPASSSRSSSKCWLTSVASLCQVGGALHEANLVAILFATMLQ
jgi:hypothetical protein